MKRKMAVLILCFAMLISVTCFTFDALAAAGDISATGNLRLPATTPTAGIIYSGSNTLIHACGGANFFAGKDAGNLTMSGVGNTASGSWALYSNETGSYNTASGVQALYYNTTGFNNTASGSGALALNRTGFDNTASGVQALYSNEIGYNNTASGSSALYSNTTGFDNTASGFEALYSNTAGHSNTASGSSALYSNTTGFDNTASGSGALYSNTTGYSNTANGSGVLSTNTTGSNNTASGYLALTNNTTGSNNTASGYLALYNNTTGHNNTAVGNRAGYTIITGSNNTFVGADSDTYGNLTNATAIGYGAIVNNSNMVRIGNAAVTVIQGEVDFSRASDFRLKKDIEEIGQGLDFVKALRPVQYRLKSGNERIDFGFIAQEIEALIGTDYNVLGIGADADRALSLRYADFIAPMVKAIQEQQGAIESQQGEINELKARLEALLMNR
jgi:hypothetical protein